MKKFGVGMLRRENTSGQASFEVIEVGATFFALHDGCLVLYRPDEHGNSEPFMAFSPSGWCVIQEKPSE